ncbi:unnamed protein product [Allacma fusca]|uniref:Ion transport domain-containing protein n=1 Tax=Allacma fusca TaxID=39272 RepID=A0A8J2PQG0_9HEXA|nr:unnamed protein product [Allacma fusca]
MQAQGPRYSVELAHDAEKKSPFIEFVTVLTDAEAMRLYKEELDIMKSPPALSERDIKYFGLVSAGKVTEFKLTEHFGIPGYFHGKLNEQGYTVWHIAVHRQDEVMLQLLLNDVDTNIVYDLLLHAITGQNLSVIVIILNTIKEVRPDLGVPSELPRWKYSQYPYDITPIILAAQIGNYKLIKYFYEMGEKFIPVYAFKREKVDKFTASDMHVAYAKLHEYQTLTSPEMICYRTNTEPDFDPILETIKLTEILDVLHAQEHELSLQYAELQKRVSDFLKSMLDECKTTEKMKLLLMQKDGYHGRNDKYPRLMLAIEKKRYEFVTHAHCQKMMYMQWAGDRWPEWRLYSGLWKALHMLFRFIFMPLICIWLYFDFYSMKAKFFRAPVNRFIQDMIAYLYFMILLAFEAVLLTLKKNADIHNTPCKPAEILIITFVCGHMFGMAKQFLLTPKSFFKVRWNYYEFLIYIVFLATFVCWGSTWYQEYVDPTPEGFPRTQWVTYDPLVLGQALYSCAIVLSYGRFMRFFQINYWIGPLQITFANLIEDISVFFFFFVVIVLSFASSIYFLYNPLVPDDEMETSHYSSYMSTLYAVFWGLLGLADAEAFEYEGDHVSETAGKFLWMIYHLVGTTMLMNMFTGYLGSTLEGISSNVDATWKWNRAKVWVYYSRQTVLPSPFNLLPSFYNCCNCFKWLAHLRSRNKKHMMMCSLDACCYMEVRETQTTKSNRAIRYSNLMRELVQRYLRSKVVSNAQPLATAGSVKLDQTRVAMNSGKGVPQKRVHRIELDDSRVNKQQTINKGGFCDGDLLPVLVNWAYFRDLFERKSWQCMEDRKLSSAEEEAQKQGEKR